MQAKCALSILHRGACRQKWLSKGNCKQNLRRRGVCPRASQANSFSPSGALQAIFTCKPLWDRPQEFIGKICLLYIRALYKISLSRGDVDRNVCPRGYCRQNILSQGCSAGRSVCLGGLQTKSVCLKGALQTKASVPGGLASQICLSWGCLQAEASVPGGIAGKTVCPKDALQVDVSVSGGLQAKFVCPRDACRQKCLSQGVCRQNLSVLGVEQHGSNYCSASLSSIGGVSLLNGIAHSLRSPPLRSKHDVTLQINSRDFSVGETTGMGGAIYNAN